MPKLTDTQLVILSAAAARDDGAALPLPSRLKLNKGSAATVLRSLVKRGLLVEQPTTVKEQIWRRDGDDGLALVLTSVGREALGIDESPEPASSDRSNSVGNLAANGKAASSTPHATSDKKPTKQAALIQLLQRPDGASIDEIAAATGWQHHSIRGAISGTVKKKLGYEVASERAEDRGRVYRIVSA